MSRTTAILIGQPHACQQLEQQLDLLGESRPVSLGWVVLDDASDGAGHDADAPLLGTVDELEAVIARRRPGVALITLPAVMRELTQALRTRLRKLGVADRFMPMLHDQLAGVGPRTHFEINPAELLARPPRQIDDAEIAGVIADRCVLITGAGGSIGSELARIAARYEPARLICVDRSENALFEIDRQIARAHPQLVRTALLHDIVDEKATLRQVAALQPDVIFHAAAHKHVPMMEDHPLAAVMNNLHGTKAIVDAAHIVGVERFVMISTDKAVNPSSIMGATKRLAELYVQHVHVHSPTSCSMVRFGNVLGSAGSVLETWARQIADGGPVTVTHPGMTRYFMTIPEAASLVLQSAALQDPDAPWGEVFLLDMGEPINICELAQRFIHAHGLEPRIGDARVRLEDPARAANAVGVMPLVFSGPRPGEKLHENLAFDAEIMTPTRHADIHIWRQSPPDSAFIEHMLDQLTRLTYRDDPGHVASVIRRLVPEMTQPVAAAATAH